MSLLFFPFLKFEDHSLSWLYFDFFHIQSGPVKRKTPTDKNEAFVSKAKKSKKQMKEVVTSVLGDDSDSDSSLDVEKWKKLVLDMTGRIVLV